jgi:hypothetical protein
MSQADEIPTQVCKFFIFISDRITILCRDLPSVFTSSMKPTFKNLYPLAAVQSRGYRRTKIIHDAKEYAVVQTSRFYSVISTGPEY